MLNQQQTQAAVILLHAYEGFLAKNEAEHAVIEETLRVLKRDAVPGKPLAKETIQAAGVKVAPKRKPMSKAHRNELSISQKARWAKIREEQAKAKTRASKIQAKGKRPSAVAEGSRIEHARHSSKRAGR